MGRQRPSPLPVSPGEGDRCDRLPPGPYPRRRGRGPDGQPGEREPGWSDRGARVPMVRGGHRGGRAGGEVPGKRGELHGGHTPVRPPASRADRQRILRSGVRRKRQRAAEPPVRRERLRWSQPQPRWADAGRQPSDRQRHGGAIRRWLRSGAAAQVARRSSVRNPWQRPLRRVPVSRRDQRASGGLHGPGQLRRSAQRGGCRGAALQGLPSQAEGLQRDRRPGMAHRDGHAGAGRRKLAVSTSRGERRLDPL